MATLTGQTIASSYEQLLHVDRDGGGNSTTLVSIKDGDNGTTFGFQVSTNALMMTSTNQLQFGDTGTYIHQSADGVLDLVSDTEIEINATTIDINGAVEMDGAITGGTNITISGELDAATLDISGNADIDGTLEADAYTVDGTALSTYIRDTVGTNMISSNTESGITVTYDTSNDNIDFSVDAAQTGITSLLATDIKIGEDDQTKIDFETADEIHFYAANVEQVYIADNIFGPQSDSDVDLGSTGVRWKDAFVDSITVTGNGTLAGTLTATTLTSKITSNNTGIEILFNADTGYKNNITGYFDGASASASNMTFKVASGSGSQATPLILKGDSSATFAGSVVVQPPDGTDSVLHLNAGGTGNARIEIDAGTSTRHPELHYKFDGTTYWTTKADPDRSHDFVLRDDANSSAIQLRIAQSTGDATFAGPIASNGHSPSSLYGLTTKTTGGDGSWAIRAINNSSSGYQGGGAYLNADGVGMSIGYGAYVASSGASSTNWALYAGAGDVKITNNLEGSTASFSSAVTLAGNIKFQSDVGSDYYGITKANHNNASSSTDIGINAKGDITLRLDTDNNSSSSNYLRMKANMSGSGASVFWIRDDGQVSCLGVTETSSIAYKKNITKIENPLDKIEKLRGIEFDYIESNEHSIGMVAEEVAEIFPELVIKDDTGKVSAMSYTRMTAVLLEAVKELNKKLINNNN